MTKGMRQRQNNKRL